MHFIDFPFRVTSVEAMACTRQAQRHVSLPVIVPKRNKYDLLCQLLPLLSSPSIEVNTANKDGMTPLHIASSMGYEEVVLALLNLTDINVNKEDNHSTTPLQWASNYGKLEVVQALLGCSETDAGKTDMDGKTALQLAERWRWSPVHRSDYLSIIELLRSPKEEVYNSREDTCPNVESALIVDKDVDNTHVEESEYDYLFEFDPLE